jgi:hypothetical protein
MTASTTGTLWRRMPGSSTSSRTMKLSSSRRMRSCSSGAWISSASPSPSLTVLSLSRIVSPRRWMASTSAL